LRRELEEELGIEAEVGGMFDAAFHVYRNIPFFSWSIAVG